jgi:hypothetical protein
MKVKLLAILLLTLTVFIAPAIARQTVQIVDYDNVAITGTGGKVLQREQIKQAIQTAAGTKGWSIASQADGKMLATLTVRGKHTIAVEIEYAVDKYSLRYRDSTNMKYSEKDGHHTIHPNYNKWVQNLRDTIRLELIRL